ncbi:MAG: hypothetical protein HY756_01535 [Nitrospirae bacterium]|nr:hypothetical protein [Nitrospirota bacterium]
MQLTKVVARFKDGSLLKGKSYDFSPQKTSFSIMTLNGEKINISIEQLKAIFIVRSFEGNKNHKDRYEDIIPGGGQRIGIKFYDDETVIGYSLCYSSKPNGFFMTPADRQSNNERIFIIKSAVKYIEFLDSFASHQKETAASRI